MGWKGEDTAATNSIPSTDIKWVQWLRVARNYQIRVALKDGTRTNFDGFAKEVRFCFILLPLFDMDYLRVCWGCGAVLTWACFCC